MISQALREAAGKAADEIERRGWVRGDLAQVTKAIDQRRPTDNVYVEWVSVPLDQCKVCALGALSAAVRGNPMLGMDTDDDTYNGIVHELADVLRPGWREELEWDPTSEDEDHQSLKFNDPFEVVYGWNDEEVDSGEQVVSRLREIAAS